ncbi:Metabotropic glutamate receptor 1 [Eumeta japonica]|uniref:Metabotropic glutamate receptor 1 n=1 Tax=Eumeta variegata TaxID=151549 RepID=A0A4C1WAR0_EUMVA|nr:Metabotropic glutamate receptor 1 [Eumeta japonica]
MQVLLCLVVGLYTSTSALAAAAGAARVAGDVRLGALFAVHDAPHGASARCGAVREHYGIQRVEATLQALDDINADSALLPGLQLGAELRDSCWAPRTALRQTLELVRDALAASQSNPSRARRAVPVTAPLVAILGPGASAAAAQVQNLVQLFSLPQLSYSATSRELSDKGRFGTFFRVVPSDLHQARTMVALLRAHNWTYVSAVHTDESYGQSGMTTFREAAAAGGVCVSRELALRAAPSERVRMQLYSLNDACNIEQLLQETDAVVVRLRAARSDVAVCWCEGRTVRALLAGLQRAGGGARPRLVATDGWADRWDVVRGLESAAHGALTLRIHSPYLYSFDSYYHALDPRNNSRNPWFEEFWEQKFGCTMRTDGARYLPRCNVSKNSGDPLPSLLQRSLTNIYSPDILFLPRSMVKKLVIPLGLQISMDGDDHLFFGTESLATQYAQEPKLALVVRGVYALAHGLHDMREALCPSPQTPLCAAMLPFNLSLYQQYLARVRFRAPDGGIVAFDENGDLPASLSEYDVMSFSRGGGHWRYVRVGCWRGGALRLRSARATAVRAAATHAACSPPCPPGYYKCSTYRYTLAGAMHVLQETTGESAARCCWACLPCPAHAVPRIGSQAHPRARANDSAHTPCRMCPPGSSPDITKTRCLATPVERRGGGGGGTGVAMMTAVLAVTGLVVVLVTAIVLWRHRSTPVVKSASRELSALLLLGASLCHVGALAGLAIPSSWACAAARLLPAPSLAVVYAAVFARTLRVARLVAAAERAARPSRLVSSAAQVWLCATLVTPAVVAVAWSASTWSPIPHVVYPTRARSVLECGGARKTAAQLVPLVPALALLVAGAVAAIRSRRLPHNYNETRFIGVAVYTTCVIWLAFFPIYRATEAKVRLLQFIYLAKAARIILNDDLQALTLATCVTLSGSAAVLLLFGPRLYVLWAKPERNTRAHFLTARSIRCHVGGYGPAHRRFVEVKRDVACQAAAPECGGDVRASNSWCDECGACARITELDDDGGDGGGVRHVVIVLMAHRHPPALTHVPPSRDY